METDKLPVSIQIGNVQAHTPCAEVLPTPGKILTEIRYTQHKQTHNGPANHNTLPNLQPTSSVNDVVHATTNARPGR